MVESVAIGAGPDQHLPVGNLRGAVPAGVERHLVVLKLTLSYHGRVVARSPAPWEAEGPIGFVVRAREAGAEEQLAIAAELREDGLAAPPDEHVANRQHLRLAHGGGK